MQNAVQLFFEGGGRKEERGAPFGCEGLPQSLVWSGGYFRLDLLLVV